MRMNGAADSQQQSGEDGSPEHKRARVIDGGVNPAKRETEAPSNGQTEQQDDPSRRRHSTASFQYLQQLLVLSSPQNQPLPLSLCTERPIRQDLQRLQSLLNNHGFRTALVSSPRPGISIYTDSANASVTNTVDWTVEQAEARRFLLIALGLDPCQEELETIYRSTFRSLWCLSLFCQKIRKAYFSKPPNDHSESNDDALLKSLEQELDSVELFCQQPPTLNESLQIDDSNERVATLIANAVKVKNVFQRFHRAEEWEREYERICARNSTLSNVHMTIFQSHHQTSIKDVVFRPGEAKYERITIFLYDPDNDEFRPPPFLFLPSLHLVLNKGIESVKAAMFESVYSNLIKLGYFATQHVKSLLEPQLLRFFLSGFLPYNQIRRGGDVSQMPLSLNARFDPTTPLAVYIHGLPGSGKSSFARHFPIALQDTLAEYADPECLVRLVKQNFNKTMKNLELELELRPNNNDMSLTSIIQSRKQNMSQTKPGLVILNLEEMPVHNPVADPDQSAVAKLICHRFGGRKGDYRQCDSSVAYSLGNRKRPPRNGIGDDCSLVTIFTSNYPLHEASQEQLQQLDIFQDLSVIEMFSISGKDRIAFAKSYFMKAFEEQDGGRHQGLCSEASLELDLDFTEGDTRPLIKFLRIVAYYSSDLINGANIEKKTTNYVQEFTRIQIQQKEQQCSIAIIAGECNGATRVAELNLLRSNDGLGKCWFPEPSVQGTTNLHQVLILWKAKALAPAVVLTKSRDKSKRLMDSLRAESHCHCIVDVNVDRYKMVKSLYDRNDGTPNLRDDIMKLGRGALVAVELICSTKQSQLLVREMIEDGPSRVAFGSGPRSALFKDGLLFALVIEGALTSAIASRVSFEM